MKYWILQTDMSEKPVVFDNIATALQSATVTWGSLQPEHQYNEKVSRYDIRAVNWMGVKTLVATIYECEIQTHVEHL